MAWCVFAWRFALRRLWNFPQRIHCIKRCAAFAPPCLLYLCYHACVCVLCALRAFAHSARARARGVWMSARARAFGAGVKSFRRLRPPDSACCLLMAVTNLPSKPSFSLYYLTLLPYSSLLFQLPSLMPCLSLHAAPPPTTTPFPSLLPSAIYGEDAMPLCTDPSFLFIFALVKWSGGMGVGVGTALPSHRLLTFGVLFEAGNAVAGAIKQGRQWAGMCWGGHFAGGVGIFGVGEVGEWEQTCMERQWKHAPPCLPQLRKRKKNKRKKKHPKMRVGGMADIAVPFSDLLRQTAWATVCLLSVAIVSHCEAQTDLPPCLYMFY